MDKNFILKAKLLEHGIKITNEAKKILDSKSNIWLMDDYITCSGLTLHFENQYATIGSNNNSKYELCSLKNELYIKNENALIKTSVIIPPEYMKDKMIIEGKKICVYVNTYTDRVRLQLSSGCTNKCKFCNATEFKYEINSIKGLEKALNIALKQSDVKHILISSGSVKISDLEEITKMYCYFGDRYSKYDIDIMMTPRGFTNYTDSSQYEDYIKLLKQHGIKGLSINMELNSKEALKKYCPEKAIIGQENYLKFIETAVKVFGKNNIRSLLIVGLEPLEETLKGVEKLAKIGCNPVLSPLFPYGEANFPPNSDLFIEAKKESEKICKKYNIEMGPLCDPCKHNVL